MIPASYYFLFVNLHLRCNYDTFSNLSDVYGIRLMQNYALRKLQLRAQLDDINFFYGMISKLLILISTFNFNKNIIVIFTIRLHV